MNDRPNDFEKRDIAFRLEIKELDWKENASTARQDWTSGPSRYLDTTMLDEPVRSDARATRPEWPDWFSLVDNRPLHLKSKEMRSEEPEILVLSGRKDDFEALFPEPDFAWVAAVEFVLDGKKYETYAMNLDFEIRDDEPADDNARAYLEIQQWKGNPWLDPQAVGERKLRIKEYGGARVSIGRISNDAGYAETSIVIRIYLEDEVSGA